jgi:hypothetical protein
MTSRLWIDRKGILDGSNSNTDQRLEFNPLIEAGFSPRGRLGIRRPSSIRGPQIDFRLMVGLMDLTRVFRPPYHISLDVVSKFKRIKFII